MKKIFDFLRLRKQYDSIKFAFLMFICAAYFLISGIAQTASYMVYVNKPCEYILEAYSDSASLEIALQKICEIEGVISASYQNNYVITTDDNKTLTVSELSSEYLSKCYGIGGSGNNKKIYLNTVAFDEFIGDSEIDLARLSYIADGKTESAGFVRIGEISSETPLALSVGTTASLDNSRVVRVMFDGIDITGSNIRKIESLGYTVSNREDILLQSHKQEMLLSEIKCCIFATSLSLVGGLAFIKISNFEHRKEKKANINL